MHEEFAPDSGHPVSDDEKGPKKRHAAHARRYDQSANQTRPQTGPVPVPALMESIACSRLRWDPTQEQRGNGRDFNALARIRRRSKLLVKMLIVPERITWKNN